MHVFPSTLEPRKLTTISLPVSNVDNPILIDQCYSTPAATCAEFPSTLTISDIHCTSSPLSCFLKLIYCYISYFAQINTLPDINITGTSSGHAGSTVASLQCSSVCQDITASGTHIVPPTGNGNATFVCKNVESVAELDFPCS